MPFSNKRNQGSLGKWLISGEKAKKKKKKPLDKPMVPESSFKKKTTIGQVKGT